MFCVLLINFAGVDFVCSVKLQCQKQHIWEMCELQFGIHFTSLVKSLQTGSYKNISVGEAYFIIQNKFSLVKLDSELNILFTLLSTHYFVFLLVGRYEHCDQSNPLRSFYDSECFSSSWRLC